MSLHNSHVYLVYLTIIARTWIAIIKNKYQLSAWSLPFSLKWSSIWQTKLDLFNFGSKTVEWNSTYIWSDNKASSVQPMLAQLKLSLAIQNLYQYSSEISFWWIEFLLWMCKSYLQHNTKIPTLGKKWFGLNPAYLLDAA